jgi:hypothetical protein
MLQSIGESKGPLLVGTGTILAILVAYASVSFSVNTNDLAAYIEWSYALPAHISYESHMPGLPAVLAAGRFITRGLLPDEVIAQLISYIAWFVSVLLAAELLKIYAPDLRSLGTYAFALAPLVGVTYVAFPTAECLARMLFLGALVSAHDKQWTRFAGIVACGLLVHQAYYPMYFFVALSCVLCKRMSWIYFLASGIPFVAYYVYVATSNADAAWILTGHRRMHLGAEQQHFPILDGILQAWTGGTGVMAFKAVLLTSVAGASVVLLVTSLRSGLWFLASICGSILFYAIMAPANVVFLIVRLSPFLVFPAANLAESSRKLTAWLGRPPVRWAVISLLVASQFGWAYYRYRFNVDT